jgi:cell division protein FtsQ
MDRSRRMGARGRATTAEQAAQPSPPSSSRITLRARKNRRRPAPLWSRMPRPAAIADACGRALRRSLSAAIAACVIVGAGGALWLAHRFVTTSPRYAITEIEVRGARHLSASEVRAIVPAALGDNVFLTSPDEVAGALRRHPWIASATAERVLPGTIRVEIREHEPAALAVIGEPYLVGADGRPFKRAQIEAGDGAGLPIVTGVDRDAYRRDPAGAARTITAALDALARWRAGAGRPPIGELHITAQGTLTLRTYDRAAAIELGPLASETAGATDAAHAAFAADAATAAAPTLEARLHTFDAAWAELDPRERARARSFHLDARPDHVTVAFAKD